MKIRITSETLPDLFQLGLNSLNQLLAPNVEKEGFSKTLEEEIDLEAPDRTSLLIDFLSEVLTYSQIHKAIFPVLEIDK